MNKYLLILLISISLIVYTNSATCSALTTEDKCKEQKGCTWAAAASCSGHNDCTSITKKNDCEAKIYEGYECSFSAGDSTASPPTQDSCSGGDACGKVSNPTSATCTAAGTAKKCTYTAAGCTGTPEEEDGSFGLKCSALLSLAFLLL